MRRNAKNPRANESGVAIFFVMMFFLIAMLGFTSIGRLGGSHVRTSQHNVAASQAMYLAESAAEQAKLALRNNFLTAFGDSGTAVFGEGEYFYNIANSPDADATKRLITAYGAIPDFDNPTSNRTVEVVVQSDSNLPVNFWDKAIYSAGKITANGNRYTVTGDCITGDKFVHAHDLIPGAETVDPSVAPLTRLNFEYLKALAESQVTAGKDNYFTAAELEAGATLPSSFYFEAPDPLVPGDTGIPNIVFIEGNLTLNGNWPDIGGFLVVVGSILTDPDATADATINGNGTINGVVYTLGEFTVNGGATGINLNGGVFAAETATMNGKTTVTYNQEYMDSIDAMNIPTGLTVLSWNEIVSDI